MNTVNTEHIAGKLLASCFLLPILAVLLFLKNLCGFIVRPFKAGRLNSIHQFLNFITLRHARSVFSRMGIKPLTTTTAMLASAALILYPIGSLSDGEGPCFKLTPINFANVPCNCDWGECDKSETYILPIQKCQSVDEGGLICEPFDLVVGSWVACERKIDGWGLFFCLLAAGGGTGTCFSVCVTAGVWTGGVACWACIASLGSGAISACSGCNVSSCTPVPAADLEPDEFGVIEKTSHRLVGVCPGAA